MNKKAFFFAAFGLIVGSCAPSPSDSHPKKQSVPLGEPLILYQASDLDASNPERGLGALADPTSTESMADADVHSRAEELLASRPYTSPNLPHEGAVIARF